MSRNKIGRTRLLALVAGIIGLMLAAVAAPASASDGNSFQGTLTFAGTADLPSFPEPPPGRSDGNFNGDILLGAGLYNGSPSVVRDNDGAEDDISATNFSYAELGSAPIGCAGGTASGTVVVDTDEVVTGPNPVQASRSFTWTRVGSTAVILIEHNSQPAGVAVAGFAAHPGSGYTNQDLVEACLGLGPKIPVTADVVGEAILID